MNNWNPLASQWFSEYLDKRVMLAHMLPKKRIKNSSSWPAPFPVNFSDGYPIHLVNEQSVEQISKWCEEEIHPLQFRPNILISGLEAFEEDKIKSFQIGNQKFDIIKPYERCIMSTIKPNEDKINKQPLSILASKRKDSNKVIFGMYAIPVLGESGLFEEIELKDMLTLKFY